jgi:phosphohistidine phosphatase
MIRLGVLRHAKSSWDDPAARDFDRPLNPRGRAAAGRMGRLFSDRGFAFDHVLASPAARVRETLERLGTEYRALPAIAFNETLYAASTRSLLDAIRSTGPQFQSLLIVGHNPGLHGLVLALAEEDGSNLRQRAEGHFPTAAFASIDLDVSDWNAISPGVGRLAELIFPRELD